MCKFFLNGILRSFPSAFHLFLIFSIPSSLLVISPQPTNTFYYKHVLYSFTSKIKQRKSKQTPTPPPTKRNVPNQNLQTLLLLQHLPLVIIQNLSSHLNMFALNFFLVKFHQKILILKFKNTVRL